MGGFGGFLGRGVLGGLGAREGRGVWEGLGRGVLVGFGLTDGDAGAPDPRRPLETLE